MGIIDKTLKGEGKSGAIANVATAGALGGIQAVAKGDVEGALTQVGGLKSIDKEFNGGKIGKQLSDLNPFKAPKLKDIPDPTAPANITAPTMAPGTSAATVRGPGSFQGATIGGVTGPKGALIDMSQQGQFRDQQQALAKQLAMQASGQGPSLAVNALKQGQEANLAATMAQLNSQRGGANPAMARATMQTAAEIQGKAAQEAADARLKEQLGAQGLLAQVSGEGRSGDITLATKQADLKQQVALEKYKGDLQLAVEQGRIDQQTAMSMFEQANQNARQDATLNAQFQALQAQYAQMGMSAQEANQRAFLEIEKMKQGAVMAANQQTLGQDAANKQMFGNILGAGATLGAAGIKAGPGGGTTPLSPGYDAGGNTNTVDTLYQPQGSNAGYS
jgi:hypothetical protein